MIAYAHHARTVAVIAAVITGQIFGIWATVRRPRSEYVEFQQRGPQ